MKHLYIDTNIYLSFYHLSSDDLEELKKLVVLIKNDSIALYSPKQTIDEFYRNRDSKISDALSKFREEKLNNQFPQMCKEYKEYNELKAVIKEYDKLKNALHDKLYSDIKDETLKADKLIYELFDLAITSETTDEIYNKAKFRYDIGNPPGKNKSYGDAINWETLLCDIPHKEDLHFVSDDKDYYSEIDKDAFNSFLNNEWQFQKRSEIHYYKKISDFFKTNFPDIKLADEYEKDILITELTDSGSFASTRSALRKLIKFEPESFTSKQLNDIAKAAVLNSQISWISSDYDINEYLNGIIQPNEAKLDPEILKSYKDEYYPKTTTRI